MTEDNEPIDLDARRDGAKLRWIRPTLTRLDTRRAKGGDHSFPESAYLHHPYS